MTLSGQPSATAVALKDNANNVLEQARSGDHEAFRLIFERYTRPVVSFLFDLVGRRDLAEDLAQETFVRAYRGLHTLRDEAKLSTWIFGIARNVARESFRSRSREDKKVRLDEAFVLDLSDEHPLPDGRLLNQELSRVIHEALNRLDEDKRVVFTLKVLHQKDYEEIAAITGFSIAKLKTDLHRARAEMRRRVRPYVELQP